MSGILVLPPLVPSAPAAAWHSLSCPCPTLTPHPQPQEPPSYCLTAQQPGSFSSSCLPFLLLSPPSSATVIDPGTTRDQVPGGNLQKDRSGASQSSPPTTSCVFPCSLFLAIQAFILSSELVLMFPTMGLDLCVCCSFYLG